MKEFWDSLTKEQQSTLAASKALAILQPGYLVRLVFNGYKRPALIWLKSWKTSHQARSLRDLRPDIYSKQ